MPASNVQDRDTRYRSLDVWRGFACLILVLYHSSFYVPEHFNPHDPGTWTLLDAMIKIIHLAWVGVPCFFVISGYCITASAFGSRSRPVSVGSFCVRRMRRIYPPLWCACIWGVAVALLLSAVWPELFERCLQLPRLSEFAIGNWVGNLTATEAWQHHVSGADTAYLMNNTWSLSFEEQFYLIAALLLLLSRRRFFVGALLISCLALVCRHGSRHLGLDIRGLCVDGHWLLFAAGMLLFYQLNGASLWVRRLISAGLMLGIAYAVVDRTWGATTRAERHLDEYLLVAFAFTLLMGLLYRFDRVVMGAAAAKPFMWCGKRSYSIYLTHYPLVVALTCALAAANLQSPAMWLVISAPLCLAVALISGWIPRIGRAAVHQWSADRTAIPSNHLRFGASH